MDGSNANGEDGGKPKRRARVACIQCRQKRGRCDGTNPCTPCRRQNTPCTYSRSDRRLWISQSDYLQLVEERDALKKRCEELEQGNGSSSLAAPGLSRQRTGSSTRDPSRQEDRPNDFAAPGDEEDEVSEGAEAAGRLLSDEKGSARFMGDSSGAAFYSALMELLQPMFPHANLMPPHPANSYQTWDSRPLPLSLASPYALPPQHLTRHLVSVFLQHCSGLFTFIYPADLDNQVNILYSLPPNTMQEIADPSSHITSSICQLYAVLAIASAHLPGLLPTSDIDRQALVNFDSGEPDFPGMAFFARAYLLLPSLVQDASVRSITTLALVAYYLLSVSHRDAAYCYVGAAVRLAVSLGLHHSAAPQIRPMFWSIVVLDRLVSTVLGRPAQIVSGYIDTPMPSIDSILGSHVQLSLVYERLTKDLYVHSAKRPGVRIYSMTAALSILQGTQSMLTVLHRGPLRGSARDETMLKLSCYQVILVACRPALLLRLRQRASGRMAISPEWAPQTPSVDDIQTLVMAAGMAAREMVQQLDLLRATGGILPWSFFDNHFAYNAGVAIALLGILGLDELGDDHLIRTIDEVQDYLVTQGNESAASCRAIIRCLRSVGALRSGQNTPQGFGLDRTAAQQVPGGVPTNWEWDELVQSLGSYM